VGCIAHSITPRCYWYSGGVPTTPKVGRILHNKGGKMAYAWYNVQLAWYALPIGQQLALVILLALVLYFVGLVRIGLSRRF